MAEYPTGIGTSTTDSNQFRPVTSFIGLRNYLNLFQDPAYLQVLRNTVILTLIVTVVPNVLGLGIALLLDHRGWVFNVMRAVFFIPVVLSSSESSGRPSSPMTVC